MSVQSVCRWLRSKSYGDLAEYFEGKYPRRCYFSCMHLCVVDIRIRREHRCRSGRETDEIGGFAILRAICGIGVKANRLMKLMEDLKKQVYIYLALTLQRNKPLLESLQYCENAMSEKVSLV